MPIDLRVIALKRVRAKKQKYRQFEFTRWHRIDKKAQRMNYWLRWKTKNINTTHQATATHTT